MRFDKKEPLLHLYPQETYHAQAAIVGSRAGLIKLRDTINSVLLKPLDTETDNMGTVSEEMTAIPGDGEVHKLTIHLLPHDHPNWNHLSKPYAENKDHRIDDDDDQDFILPPSWGMGLMRKLDVVYLPYSIEMSEEQSDKEDLEYFMHYSELSDPEKGEFKRYLKEKELEENRGGAT